MPYLLQSNQNRVENIKKKFENSYFDAKEDNPSRNFKPFNLPSKTKLELDSRPGNLENECDISDKHQFKSDKPLVKSEINKVDGKAVVRRSPAFRREKLNYGKTIAKLSNSNDNTPLERRNFPKIRVQPINSLNDVPNTVKLNNSNIPRNCVESNQFLNFQNTTSNKDNISSNTIPISTQLRQEKAKSIGNGNVSGQYSVVNKSNPGTSPGNKSKNELKLTDSIRLALKAPLPKGPPPKKPPRTFIHTIQNTGALTNEKDQSSSSSSVSTKDPLLRLKLEKIEKVVKKLETRTQVQMPMDENKIDVRRPKVTNSIEVNNVPSQPSFVKLLDTFSLKNLSCNSAESYEKASVLEKEPEKQACFYVDIPKDGKDCNKTETKNSVLGGGMPLFDLVPNKNSTEPIYDLPCITKRNSFESFGKGARKGGSNTSKQLHYMCTDVVNSIQEGTPLIFSPLNQGESNLHADGFNDKIKSFVPNRQKVKETATNDSKSENNGIESKKIEKESVKSIMNDVFNSMKRGSKHCSPSGADYDSDSESTSSGMEESNLVHAEDNKSVQSVYNKNSDDRCLPLSNGRKEAMMSLATASRKTYVKRVSSKLLSHSPYTKSVGNESFTHLFESCILVGLTLSDSKTTVSYIKSIFPSNVKPPPLIESLCFPDASTWSQSSCNLQQGEQYYSLVITNENGDRKFGYCRRVLPEGGNFCLPLVYCIISQHRANGFYYKVLQELESRHGSSDLHVFIKQLYECNFPGPGQSLKFKKILEEVTRVSPVKGDDSLPSTLVRRPCDVRLEERDLSQLLQHLKVSLLLKIFGSLLLERKVLLLGHSLRNLSCCIEALQSLLIPFSWQHTYIPILPSNLNEMCDAPTPYVIGVQKSTVSPEFISNLHFEEGIMVDLEESHVIKCCGDEDSIIPHRLTKGLKTALNLAVSASLQSDNDRNVLISEAFIRFFVEIVGNYSSFIVRQPDGRKIFQKEDFVNSVPGIHSFLDWFVETAMFRSFIQERLQNDIEDLFKRRTLEHKEEIDKNGALKNYRVMNKKVRSLGDRLKDLTIFPK